MQPVTIRIPDDTHRTLAAEADESARSMSEVVRERVEQGMDYDGLERENERLRAEKRTLISNREEHHELVEYVEEERTLQQRREERQEERRNAPAWTRAKWWLLGR